MVIAERNTNALPPNGQAELGAPAGLAFEISFNKFGMRICFLGLSQNIASYSRRLSRRIVQHQTRLLTGPDKLPSTVVESAIRSANRAPNLSAQRRRKIVMLLRDSSPADAAVEGKLATGSQAREILQSNVNLFLPDVCKGIAFFKSCSGGVCFSNGDLLPTEAASLLGDLKSIFRTVTGSNVRPVPAVPNAEDINYRPTWIPRSASSCSIAGASLISDACGRVPR